MPETPSIEAADVKLIVFACEAGMGSSVMGANQLRKLVKKAGVAAEVVHCPVGQLDDRADIVVVHKGLASQAKSRLPSTVIIPFTMFMNDPAVTGLVKQLAAGEAITSRL